MSNIYSQILSPKTSETLQSDPIFGREAEMVSNYAGGVVFQLDEWSYLDRFLILGSAENSYYATNKTLTLKAAKNIMNLITLNPIRVVDRIVEISKAGRAPKNDPAVFALALVAINADEEGRKYAFDKLTDVCRIGTHLFQFTEALNSMGKWNAAAKRGVANWYESKDIIQLAYQMLKYQSRGGWSHRDVIRLAHIKPRSVERSSVYGWAVAKDNETRRSIIEKAEIMPLIFDAYMELHQENSVSAALKAIETHNMSWEMLPTSVLREPQIWEALLPTIGYTALLRNLGRIASIGMMDPLSDFSSKVMDKLSNVTIIENSRVHPITILNALKTYGQGHGDKGSLSWAVNKRVKETLNESFYDAFRNVQPTGKKMMLGIDCSGSMWGALVGGLSNICAAEAAAVTALAIVKKEKNYWIGGFDTSISELDINPSMSLETVLHTMQQFNWRGTDCAQPMLHATKHKMDVDAFITITDNETWAGRIHPTEALRNYRKEMNKPNACNIVCGTSVTDFTIADPKDPLQMDIVGFDSAAPQLIADFIRGK